MGWKAIADKLDGLATVQHAALTCCGTWGTPGVGFQSDVINGINQYVSPDLMFEVPVIYPGAFGPITGTSITAPSYQQSITLGVQWYGTWLAANPTRTHVITGYSQGAELAARMAIEVTTGSLSQYKDNLVAGCTFGPPSRGQGFTAPTCPDPGGSGISSVNMTLANMPIVNGQNCWADYCEVGDMYGSTPGLLPDGKTLSQVGVFMRDAYTLATNEQLNDFPTFLTFNVTQLLTMFEQLGGIKAIIGSGAIPTGLEGDLVGLLTTLGPAALLGFFSELIDPGEEYTSSATGVQAAFIAASVGLQFLVTGAAPHGWYEGGGGPRNYVGDAVGFLANAAALTPARS